MRSAIQVLLVSALAVLGGVPCTADVDHAAWDGLLRRYVNEEGRVSYVAALAASDSVLPDYLVSVATAQPDQFASQEEQLAFWINAYNACVFKGVLDRYPVQSVKDIRGFFDKIRYRVANQDLTLNQIEAKGRALGDWRIHFAVVCAATGCPVLRSEAYVPERVSAQLDAQVNRYLVDEVHGMRVEYPSKTLWVSKIFKWYAKDFVPAGPFTAKSLWAVIGGFVPQDKPLLPVPEQFSLKFLDYDWSLNERSVP